MFSASKIFSQILIKYVYTVLQCDSLHYIVANSTDRKYTQLPPFDGQYFAINCVNVAKNDSQDQPSFPHTSSADCSLSYILITNFCALIIIYS